MAEKYYWRDHCLNMFHRDFGRTIYMTDIDWLEYDTSHQPLAIIECKMDTFDLTTYQAKSQVQVQFNLAERAGLPYFRNVYNKNLDVFIITGKNNKAIEWMEICEIGTYIDKRTRRFSRKDLIEFLHKLHGECFKEDDSWIDRTFKETIEYKKEILKKYIESFKKELSEIEEY